MIKDVENIKTEFGLIGAGRVGYALSRLLSECGYTFRFIADKDIEKADLCRKTCRAGSVYEKISFIQEPVSFILIAVPDDDIHSVAEELRDSKIIQPGICICHTSGLHSSDALSVVKARNVRICSMHPCFSFRETFTDDLKGIHFAVEGDSSCLPLLEMLIRDFGGIPHRLSQEEKVLYHTACTIVSSGLVSLIGAVQKIGPEKSGLEMFWPLMQVTLDNLKERGIEKSLTGPIQRGDVQTVQKHLESLQLKHPELISIYLSLSENIFGMSDILRLHKDRIESFKKLFEDYKKH